jgi:membrane protease YdiL (CAAX protease family)
MQRIDLLVVVYLLFFAVFIPRLAIKSARLVREGAPLPRRWKIFLGVLGMQGFFLGIALVVASAARIDLSGPGAVTGRAALAVAGTLLASVAAGQLIWRHTSPELGRRLLVSRPHHAREMGWWLLVSLAAGVVEEIVYRGVMPSLLAPALLRWTGDPSARWHEPLGGDFTVHWWVAVAVCVAAFVLGHHGQGGARAAFLAAFAIACHLLVRTTGSLVPAMVLHVLYDVAAGLAAIRIVRRMESGILGR